MGSTFEDYNWGEAANCSPQLQMSDERFAYSPHAVIASSA